jgi:cytochrome P450
MIQNPNGRYVVVYNDLMGGALNALYLVFPFLDRFPIGRRRELHGKLNEFDELLYDIIRQKKEDLESGKVTADSDLLSMMIHATNNSSGEAKLSDRELRDNFVVFFTAGVSVSFLHDGYANLIFILFVAA